MITKPAVNARVRLALWLIGNRPLVTNVTVYGFVAGRDQRPVTKHNTHIIWTRDVSPRKSHV